MGAYQWATRTMFARPFTYLWVRGDGDGLSADRRPPAGPPVVVGGGWTLNHGALFEALREDLRRDIATLTGGGSPRQESWDLVEDTLDAYCHGEVSALDRIPVWQRSGPFREHCWQLLRTVPPNEPISYQDFAALAGNPRAVRAAGGSCARNTIALIVPCHRIIAADGSLGGYAYDLDLKRELLDHESTAAPR